MKIRWFVLVALMGIFVVSGFAFAQTAGPDVRPDYVEQNLRRIDNQIDQMKNEIKASRDDLAEFKNMIKGLAIGGSIITLIAGALAIASYFNKSKADEKREAFITELLQLYQVGESQAQARARALHDVMISKGQETLDLVNGTLALAKQASDGAINAFKVRVEGLRDNLGLEIGNYISQFEGVDNRSMTERRDYRDVLVQLTHKVSAFMYSNNTLQPPLSLTPGFRFIQCMDEEINQRFYDAINKFNVLAQDQTVSIDLRIRCFYWMGYVQNNIGDFDGAQASFHRAIRICQQDNQLGRSYWLERLLIETMLFSRANTSDLIQRVDNVVTEVLGSHITQQEKSQLKDAFEITKSNIYQAAAMDAWFDKRPADAKAFMAQSLAVLQDQKARGVQTALREWAFGSIMMHQNVSEAEGILKSKVLDSARDGLLTHIGTRHKAYYTAILAMCHSALKNRDRVMDFQTRGAQYVAEVHDRMFVYSPMTKRNVTREAFLNEIRKIVDQFIVF
jgi:hypothetical protein